MAISRILCGQILSQDDHLSLPIRNRGTRAQSRSRDRDATIPEDLYRAGCPSSVLSCTAWGFSCLVNYFTSGELLPRLFTLTGNLLPKSRRYLFCDTFRHRSFSTVMPTRFARHAAVWCSDFPPANRKRFTSDHLPSANNLSQGMKNKMTEKQQSTTRRERAAISEAGSKWRRHRHEENCDHHKGNKELSDHCTKISQQTPPTGPARINHSFTSDEFTRDGANH